MTAEGYGASRRTPPPSFFYRHPVPWDELQNFSSDFSCLHSPRHSATFLPMARQLRCEFTGAWYLMMSREFQRQPIFVDDNDRRHLLELLEKTVGRDFALYAARHHGGATLRNLGQEVGVSAFAVGQSVLRFGRKLQKDPVLSGVYVELVNLLSEEKESNVTSC